MCDHYLYSMLMCVYNLLSMLIGKICCSNVESWYSAYSSNLAVDVVDIIYAWTSYTFTHNSAQCDITFTYRKDITWQSITGHVVNA